MRRSLFGLAGALVVVFFSAQPALAGAEGPFSTTSVGVSEFDKGGMLVIDADVLFQVPDLGLETFDGEFMLTEGGELGFEGGFLLAGSEGDFTADAFGSFFFDKDSGFAIGSGFWELSDGSGIFEGLSGVGTISVVIDGASGETIVKVGGILVPAPGVLAGMGLAGLTMRRRRRRTT